MWYSFKVCDLSVRKLVASVGGISALEGALNWLTKEIFHYGAIWFVISQVFTVHFHCVLTVFWQTFSWAIFRIRLPGVELCTLKTAPCSRTDVLARSPLSLIWKKAPRGRSDFQNLFLLAAKCFPPHPLLGWFWFSTSSFSQSSIHQHLHSPWAIGHVDSLKTGEERLWIPNLTFSTGEVWKWGSHCFSGLTSHIALSDKATEIRVDVNLLLFGFYFHNSGEKQTCTQRICGR